MIASVATTLFWMLVWVWAVVILGYIAAVVYKKDQRRKRRRR